MKIRIKIIEKNNGTKMFIPQAKDKFSFLGLFLNILFIVVSGKRYNRYYGLTKIEDFGFGEIFGMKKGDIVKCSDEGAVFFFNYEEAQAFLDEYAKQEKLNICRSKEEVDETRRLNELEKIRVNGEKIKNVKYINVKTI